MHNITFKLCLWTQHIKNKAVITDEGIQHSARLQEFNCSVCNTLNNIEQQIHDFALVTCSNTGTISQYNPLPYAFVPKFTKKVKV